MKKKLMFGLFSITLLFISYSFSSDDTSKMNEDRVVHCFEFRVTCEGKSGFYDTVQAGSWGEATKKIKAKYPNCKATQVKQNDC